MTQAIHGWLGTRDQTENLFTWSKIKVDLLRRALPYMKYEKALVCKRYYPPDELTQAITSFVEQQGGKDFFENQSWKEQLFRYHQKLVEQYKSREQTESEAAYHQRVFNELEESKREIENHLCKQVDFICWPGGGYNQTVLDFARQAGYKAWTLASSDNTPFRNVPESDQQQVKRIASFSRFSGSGVLSHVQTNARYFICGVERHKGSKRHLWLGRMLHVYALFKLWMRKLLLET